MNAPLIIAKETADAEGLDFAALRRAGIESLQSLCGSIWTDFNVHDPGVTILEQLCFGLTELAYRSDLPPEDFLAAADGSIDYERQALYPPEDILPSGCVTDTDYRKLLLDELPEIDNLHFEWGGAQDDAGTLPHGAYSLIVSAENWLSEAPERRGERIAELLTRVRAVLNANRGLCERPLHIEVAHSMEVHLQGELIVADDIDHAAILAMLHFRCAALIAARVDALRYDDVLAANPSLEEIFSGPFTEYGYIADANMRRDAAGVIESDLIRAARSVPGVERVMDLRLVGKDGRPLSLGDFGLRRKRVLSLCLPQPHSAQSGLLRLRNASGAAEESIDLLLDAAHAELLKLRFEFQSYRYSRQSRERLVRLPTGTRRELGDYYSIQHHFPPVYALGRDGLPRNAPPERRAAVSQLKAYLYPFEQLMANYLQSLEEVGPLFSVDDRTHSYAAQFIDNGRLPDIEALYIDDSARTRAEVPRILAEFDPVHERRGRALDYLLAIYGEAIPEAALRRFSPVQGAAQDAWLNEIRLRLLKALPELGRYRGRAFDYSQPALEGGNLSTLQKKVSILLGLEDATTARLLSQAPADAGARLGETAPQSWTGVDAELQRRIAPMPVGRAPGKAASLGRELSMPVFRYGAALANYRVVKCEGVDALCITPDGGRTLWPIAQSTDRNTLIAEAHALRHAVAQLNQSCEGFHLLEHILLRPPGDAAAQERPFPESFYAGRLSIVFPGWCARFADANFRDFAMETVCRELPAHVLPDFYWFDFAATKHFEMLYRNWLDHLHRFEHEGADAAGLNKAAERLAVFLLRAQDTEAYVPRYWI